jgi:hypothetical protein
MEVKEGQLWITNDRTEFRVINVVDIDNNTWVYYRNEKSGNEYSCYKESFESRFTPIVNRH